MVKTLTIEIKAQWLTDCNENPFCLVFLGKKIVMESRNYSTIRIKR
jgi:hypothetical protein